MFFVYGEDGKRTNKYTKFSETLYYNNFWGYYRDVSTSSGDGQVVKHVFLGETRLATTLNDYNLSKYGNYADEKNHLYYYHADHLGSASLITDNRGDEYERIEYTPYGETWIDIKQQNKAELVPMNYRFSAKELDKETGFYYFGARYLDPKYSRWISADPALGEYIPAAPVSDEARRHNENLPGMGGLFNTVNLNLYHYASNNPIKYIDPTGQWIDNHDGTFTAEEGDTLWAKYGANWREESGYTGDPTKLQPGDIVGKQLCEWKQQSSNKGVDLNFFANNSKDCTIHDYAKLVDNPDNTFVIGGHGSTRVFKDRNGNNVSPEKLAELVKNNPNYKPGMDIKLLFCDLGGKTSGYDNYAQRFANAMGKGVNVYAATEMCWYYSNGNIKVAGYSILFKDQPGLIFRRGTFKCFTAN